MELKDCSSADTDAGPDAGPGLERCVLCTNFRTSVVYCTNFCTSVVYALLHYCKFVELGMQHCFFKPQAIYISTQSTQEDKWKSWYCRPAGARPSWAIHDQQCQAN